MDPQPNSLAEREFCLFTSNVKTDPPARHVITLPRLADFIRENENLADLTRELRAMKEGDPDGYRAAKSDRLPWCTPSGLFPDGSLPTADTLERHTGLVVLDIDEDMPPPFAGLRGDLCGNPHIAMLAESVGGDLWALVPVDPIPNSPEEHRAAVAAVVAALDCKHVSDSQNDVRRARFLAHDPDPYLNLDAVAVGWEMPQPKERPSAPATAEAPTEADMRDVLGHIPLAVLNKHADWFRIMAGLKAGGYSLDFARSAVGGHHTERDEMTERRWQSIDPGKTGGVGLGTVYDYAKQGGWQRSVQPGQNARAGAVWHTPEPTPEQIGATREAPLQGVEELPELPVVDHYCDAMFQATLSPFEFHRAIFLTLAGTILADKRYIRTPWAKQIIPNLYCALIAESTTFRKSTAINAGMKLLRGEGLEQYQLPTTWTPESLLTTLCRLQPANDPDAIVSGVCWRDEIGDLLKPRQDYMAGSHNLLLRMYDNQFTYVETQKRGEEKIHTPALSILGATTPEHAARALDDSMVADGFVVRWIFQVVEGEPKFGMRPKHLNDLELRRTFHALARLPVKCYTVSPFQFNLVQDWSEGKQKNATDGLGRDFELAVYGRSHDRALRFAIILQSLWTPENTAMTDESLHCGMALADYYDHQTFTLQRLAEEREVNRGSIAKIVDRLSAREGVMPERDLMRSLDVRRSTLDIYLKAAVRAGAVERYQDGRSKMVRLLSDSARQVRL